MSGQVLHVRPSTSASSKEHVEAHAKLAELIDNLEGGVAGPPGPEGPAGPQGPIGLTGSASTGYQDPNGTRLTLEEK